LEQDQARDAEGRCIATGIFPGLHERFYFFGGASWREHQKLFPNELMHWHAMKYWKSKGVKAYNMVGTMDFKQKFGGTETATPTIRKSKYGFISFLRFKAPALMKSMMHLAWRAKKAIGGARTR